MINNIRIFHGGTGVSSFGTLFIGPNVKHFNDSIKLIDILLDHEVLHLVLNNLGEKEASKKLDIGIPSVVIEDLRVGLEGLDKR